MPLFMHKMAHFGGKNGQNLNIAPNWNPKNSIHLVLQGTFDKEQYLQGVEIWKKKDLTPCL